MKSGITYSGLKHIYKFFWHLLIKHIIKCSLVSMNTIHCHSIDLNMKEQLWRYTSERIFKTHQNHFIYKISALIIQQQNSFSNEKKLCMTIRIPHFQGLVHRRTVKHLRMYSSRISMRVYHSVRAVFYQTRFTSYLPASNE